MRRRDGYIRKGKNSRCYAEIEAGLSGQIRSSVATKRSARSSAAGSQTRAAKFEEVARNLWEMDVERLWAEATDLERRVIVEELLESVADHLEVTERRATAERRARGGRIDWGWQFRGVGGGI